MSTVADAVQAAARPTGDPHQLTEIMEEVLYGLLGVFYAGDYYRKQEYTRDTVEVTAASLAGLLSQLFNDLDRLHGDRMSEVPRVAG